MKSFIKIIVFALTVFFIQFTLQYAAALTCSPPPSGNWIINASCTLANSTKIPANLTMISGSVLTIPTGMTLQMDLQHNHILIQSDAGIRVRSGGTILAPSVQDCILHCYAIQNAEISSLSGEKHTEIVADLTTSTTCPTNSEFIDEEGWIVFANNDWIESGFTKGFLQGVCRTSEHSFDAWSIGGFYQEFDLGAVSIGSTQTYEMSDTDQDKTWEVYDNGISTAQITMTSATAANVQEGEETSYYSSTASKTDISSIQTFSGTPPGWINLASGTNPYVQDTSQGLWISNCSPSYTHITTGMGGTASC
jgi:hypothetical protein